MTTESKQQADSTNHLLKRAIQAYDSAQPGFLEESCQNALTHWCFGRQYLGSGTLVPHLADSLVTYGNVNCLSGISGGIIPRNDMTAPHSNKALGTYNSGHEVTGVTGSNTMGAGSLAPH